MNTYQIPNIFFDEWMLKVTPEEFVAIICTYVHRVEEAEFIAKKTKLSDKQAKDCLESLRVKRMLPSQYLGGKS